jgi:hypothetical protein
VTNRTDIAALSAGVVAVAVSLFVAPGQYSLFNFLFSSTLITIILAYVWPGDRSWLQSLAVATAIALAALPAVGFIGEVWLSRSPLKHLVGAYEWNCPPAAQWESTYVDFDPREYFPCRAGDERTRMPAWPFLIAWLALVFATLGADRLYQDRWRPKPQEFPAGPPRATPTPAEVKGSTSPPGAEPHQGSPQ